MGWPRIVQVVLSGEPEEPHCGAEVMQSSLAREEGIPAGRAERSRSQLCLNIYGGAGCQAPEHRSWGEAEAPWKSRAFTHADWAISVEQVP